jgi:uncharacterized membrane protein
LARLFLDHPRAEAETRQYAEGLFVEHELFTAPGRRGVVLMVAGFERKVVILPDRGLQAALTPAVLESAVAAMTARMARGEVAAAFEAGLAAMEPHLGAPLPGTVSAGKLFPDEPILGREP